MDSAPPTPHEPDDTRSLSSQVAPTPSPEQADADDSLRRFVDLLVREGLLAPDQARRALVLARSPDLPPPAAGAQTGPPGTPFGRYRLLEILGRGGMGEVWKAWDTQLQRTVALKQLLAKNAIDRATIDRFMREAQAAAKLRHPGIVPVHDVGVHEGRHFFTTDFIDGSSLDRKMTEPIPTRRVLEIVRAVGEALQYAHEQGIVHRDVKPANILVDAAGKAFLTDFGLAKDVERAIEGGLTQSGDLIGTPKYMSPEQASGDRLKQGPASDQFSLGATLYALLTGRPPFAGANLFAILYAIAQRDPDRPATLNPRLHRDVETICLKSLEKDPLKRYVTVGEMAADLGRYLEGEPILARPVSTAERLVRRARKHVAIVATGALALALGLTLLISSAVGAARRARGLAEALERGARAERAALERTGPEAEEELKRARDAYVEARLLAESNEAANSGWERVDVGLRKATAARERASREAHEAVDKSERVQGVLARWVAIADSVRALERARYHSGLPDTEWSKAVDAAWPDVKRFLADTPPDAASQSVALALAGWARCLAGDPDEGQRWIHDARGRDPALPYGALMEALVDLSSYVEKAPGPPMNVGEHGFVRGPSPPETGEMIVLRERMERNLAEAAAAPVWGKGMVESFRAALAGLQAGLRGDFDEADQRISATAGTGAMSVFRSTLIIQRGRWRYAANRYAEALADFDEALRARPDWAYLFDYVGQVKWACAGEEASRGRDPEGIFQEAIDAFGKALQLSPEFAEFSLHCGNIHLGRGAYRFDHGGNPAPDFAAALVHYGKALALDPALPQSHAGRALVRMFQGCAAVERGEDPAEHFLAALAESDGLAAGSEDPESLRSGRASTCCMFGEWLEKSGKDGREYFARAAAACTEALKLEPASADLHRRLALALAGRATAEAARGGDPAELFGHAFDAIREALRLDPSSVLVQGDAGALYHKRAQARKAAGADPSADYAECVAAYGRALALNPDNADVLLWRAGAHFDLAGRAQAARADPRAECGLALADVNESLRRKPGVGEALLLRAEVRTSLARADLAHGIDARPALRDAIADADEAQRRRPSLARVHFSRGVAEMAIGDADSVLEGDGRPAWTRAKEELGEYLKLEPDQCMAWIDHGLCWMSLAQAEAARGKDGRELREHALADFTEAVRVQPMSWEARADRAGQLASLGRFPEAEAELVEALRLNPGEPTMVRVLAAVRAEIANRSAAWTQGLHEADALTNQGKTAAARAKYEEALAAVPAAAESEPAQRSALGAAQYNLACIYALLSAGRNAPGAAPAAVTAEEAAALRDRAFERLRKAIDLGFRDFAHIAADTDLEPLHADSRWSAISSGGK